MISFGIHQIGEVKIDEDACYIEIHEPYTLGLRHIEKFGHIIVLWWISKRDNPKDRATMLVTPPRLSEPVETGVFSSRSPSRPNPIGLTKVKLLKVEKNTLFVDRIDALDGTPVLDLKPYLPGDSVPLNDIKLPGWFESLRDK
ncbi:MAG: tRNA (N6-threonylcarbamoyladenosine(37)-N6)-methyltransferase TrmO [Candidatus Heimdallarchaeota archaeon]|nr:tRNA (N6-threonylcarbamoyladenosine(37)-N6)-methyltransferase TrmO [Candidatus Heimdallarchaeota archaeon]